MILQTSLLVCPTSPVLCTLLLPFLPYQSDSYSSFLPKLFFLWLFRYIWMPSKNLALGSHPHLIKVLLGRRIKCSHSVFGPPGRWRNWTRTEVSSETHCLSVRPAVHNSFFLEPPFPTPFPSALERSHEPSYTLSRANWIQLPPSFSVLASGNKMIQERKIIPLPVSFLSESDLRLHLPLSGWNLYGL